MKLVETKEQKIRRFAFDPNRDKVVEDLGFNRNDQYFEKKADRSLETLKRVGFPSELLRIQTKKQ